MKVHSEPQIMLDKVDKKILNVLNQNARISLTKLARSVNFSVDGIRKRMLKFQKNRVLLRYIAIPNYELLNFQISANVLIRTKSVPEARLRTFITSLKQHKRVTYLLSTAGEFDLSLTIVAKSVEDFDRISSELRSKFPDVIDRWSSNLITKSHKLEELRF